MTDRTWWIVAVLMSVLALRADCQTATKPQTAAELSRTLTAQCKKLRDTKLPDPDLGKVVCAAAKNPATDDDVKKCRADFVSTIAADLTASVDAELAKQSAEVTTTFADDSRVIQRLHRVLVTRETTLNRAIADAVSKALKDVKIAADGSDTLLARAKAAIKPVIPAVKDAVADAVFDQCIDNDPTVIEATFPKAPTPAEAAASNQQLAQQIMSEAERQAFADFTKSEGYSRTVECLWGTLSDNGQTRAKLTCKPGLLVSGEQISEIRIHNLPLRDVEVTALSSEQFKQSWACRDDADLSCDHISFPVVDPNPVVIAVHTTRLLSPTWGSRTGSDLRSAKRILRREGRSKLSILTTGTAPTISVSVRAGADEATAAVPLGFARWKIESGGFLAVSKLVDDEVVTGAATGSSNVVVKAVRRADNVSQDSGVFATFVPQNYQSVGVTLGFATPPDRRMSLYLGPSLRVRTFGDRGLASLGGGLAMRSVLRFTDVNVGDSVAPDSAALKGREQYGFSWFLAVNLGFRIGAFGPAEEK